LNSEGCESLEAGAGVAAAPEPSWSCRPLQSVTGRWSSRRIGLPAPGPTSALAAPALPVFLASPLPGDATLRAILSWGSALLHGMSRSPCPRPPRTRAPLMGFLAPSALEEEGTHGPRGCPLELPGGWARDSADESHLAGYGAAHRLSQPRSGFWFPPPSCRFQTGGAPGVDPPGICSLHTAPVARRHQHALLTFLPPAALPLPRQGNRQARRQHLGDAGRPLSSSSGPSSV
jgi:hypothetical protein